MALSLQDGNLVWQKVAKALAVQNAEKGTGAGNPASQNAFRALKQQLAGPGLNKQLQFITFGEADIDASTGYVPGIGGAFTLYGVWARKNLTGTTSAYVSVYDAATNATGSAARIGLRFKTVGEEGFAIYPAGYPFATDLDIASTTTIGGSTATTGDSDSQAGFAIIGA